MKRQVRLFILILVISGLFVSPGFAEEEEENAQDEIYSKCAFVDSPTDLVSNPAFFQKTATCVFSDSTAVKALVLLILLIYLFFEPIFVDLIIESPIVLGFDLVGLLISILSAVFLWTLGPLRWALIYLALAGTGIYLAIVTFLFFANIMRTRQKRAEIAEEEPLMR